MRETRPGVLVLKLEAPNVSVNDHVLELPLQVDDHANYLA